MRGFNRHTRLKRDIESRLGLCLADWLPRQLNQRTQADIAQELSVSVATVGYWALQLGLTPRKVWVGPDEEVCIVPRNGAALAPRIRRVDKSAQIG